MAIVDTHAHIYPDAIAGRAVSSIGEFYQIEMGLDGTLTTLLEKGTAAGVTQFWIHSAAVTWERVAAINDFIHRSVQTHPECLVGFGTMHAEHPGVEKELDRMLQLGLKGVKLHPDFQHFCLDDPKAIHMFEAMAERNLPAIIHTGDTRYPYSDPERMARALDRVPSLKAVCAHLGGWSVWDQAWKLLAGRGNVWVDTSSSLYAMEPETAVKVIHRYGVDRVFFGTDYPMWKPDEELARFGALPLTEGEREQILHRNSEAFLAALNEEGQA